MHSGGGFGITNEVEAIGIIIEAIARAEEQAIAPVSKRYNAATAKPAVGRSITGGR